MTWWNINLLMGKKFFLNTEYDALSRLGLPDPKGYCRKRFKESPLLLLSSCCVGRQILDQIEGAIEEGLASESWVDIMVSHGRRKGKIEILTS